MFDSISSRQRPGRVQSQQELKNGTMASYASALEQSEIGLRRISFSNSVLKGDPSGG